MATDDDDFDAGTNSEPDEPPRESRRMRDTFTKAVSQGFRSVRSGEEKIRGMLTEAMPKELVTYIKGAIDTGRDEVVRIVGNQTRKFLEGIDVGGEVAKILTAVSFEIKTEIRFIPNDQKIKPDIKTSIRPKKVKDDKPKDEEE